MQRTLGASFAVWMALNLAGCVPDLSGWSVVRVGPDGSIVPPPGSCAPPVTCGDCALPWLLASVEDLGDECGGQVWRWSIASDGELCTCTPLDAGGMMPRLPFSIGFVPPQTVVVAAEGESVLAIDASTDTALWSEAYAAQPVDIFAIEDLSGRMMVGVAGRNRGGDIRSVSFYDAAAGGPPIVRQANGDLPIGLGIASITQSPLDRRWFRSLKSSSWAASDVNPWTDERFSTPDHTNGMEGFFLHTIHASYDGRSHQTVWTGERTDLADQPSGVFRIARSPDDGDNSLPPAETCETLPDGSDHVTCDYLHAVANPALGLDPNTLAICEHGSGERRIVLMRSFGSCATVVEQSSVFADARISRLAIAQTSFWQ